MSLTFLFFFSGWSLGTDGAIEVIKAVADEFLMSIFPHCITYIYLCTFRTKIGMLGNADFVDRTFPWFSEAMFIPMCV